MGTWIYFREGKAAKGEEMGAAFRMPCPLKQWFSTCHCPYGLPRLWDPLPFFTYFLNRLVFELDFLCVMGHDASSHEIESRGQRSRSRIIVRVAYRLTAVIVRVYCDVISCVLARRGVRRGAAEASGIGGVQHV